MRQEDREQDTPQVITGEPPRRNFVAAALATVISLTLGAIPLALGSIYALDPLLRKRKTSAGGSGKDGFVRLNVTRDALPADGTPQRFTIVTDKTDAWNLYRDQPIGTVALRRTPADELQAFNVICPHLGCSVEFRAADQDFFCPCHHSTFDLDGSRANKIPPRDLDSLEVQEDEDGVLWVKYINFRAATAEKIPV